MIRPLLFAAVVSLILLGAFAAPLPGRADHNLEHLCEQFFSGELGEQVPIKVLTECGPPPAPDSGESSQPEAPPEQPEQAPAEPEQAPAEPEPDADAGPAPDAVEEAGPPPDAAEDAEPPEVASVIDISEALVEALAAESGSVAEIRWEEVADCGPVDPQRPRPCDALARAYPRAEEIRDEFLERLGAVGEAQPTLRELQVARSLLVAAQAAGTIGRDGKALFPSLAPAMPVIVKLSLSAAAGDDRARSALQRFTNLLAALDRNKWDERFP